MQKATTSTSFELTFEVAYKTVSRDSVVKMDYTLAHSDLSTETWETWKLGHSPELPILTQDLTW